MKLTHCLSAIALACLPALGSAAPITYTFQVVDLRQEGPTSPAEDFGFTLVVQANTDDLQPFGSYSLVPAGSHSFTYRGVTGQLDDTFNIDLYVAIDSNPSLGVTFGFDSGDWLAMGSDGPLGTYDLVSDFAPYTVTDPDVMLSGDPLKFNGQLLSYSSVTSATFSAVLGNDVPEPGSFALAGLALAGLALTRRRKA